MTWSPTRNQSPKPSKVLPFGAVTMLGPDPGTGKTVFLYRIAEAVSYGTKFMGQLNCVQRQRAVGAEGREATNLAQKNEKIQLRDPDRKILVKPNSAQVIFQSWRNGLKSTTPDMW